MEHVQRVVGESEHNRGLVAEPPAEVPLGSPWSYVNKLTTTSRTSNNHESRKPDLTIPSDTERAP